MTSDTAVAGSPVDRSGLVGPTISVISQSSVPQERMGVATSGRQFFMQIGQVMGVAILGVVFATSYVSSFEKDLPATARAQMPADVYQGFTDPTLPLDPKRFNAARDEILLLPDGQLVLDQAVLAQRTAITSATDRIFLGAVLGAIVVVILAITIREIPLRRTFSEIEPVEGHAEPHGVPAIELG